MGQNYINFHLAQKYHTICLDMLIAEKRFLESLINGFCTIPFLPSFNETKLATNNYNHTFPVKYACYK